MIVLEDPRLVAGHLSFTVRVLGPDGRVVLVVRGVRAGFGRLQGPSVRLARKWYNLVELGDGLRGDILGAVERNGWKQLYSNIAWPEATGRV